MSQQLFMNLPKNVLLVSLKELRHKFNVTDRTLRRWKALYGLEPRGYTGNMPLFSLKDVETMEKARLSRMEKLRRKNSARGKAKR